MPTWTLSDNHRRGISSTLGLLDEMLCRFERWARGEASKGVLYREQNSLGRKQRRAILRRIAAMRQILNELRDSLDLPVKNRQVGPAIWSQASAYWESLVELRAKSLERYGQVPEGFEGYFDCRVEQLTAHLMAIASLTAGDSTSPHQADHGRLRSGREPCP